MEPIPTNFGFGESPVKKPEADKEEDKDMKPSKKRLSAEALISYAVPEKPKEKSVVEFFRRPAEAELREPKLFDFGGQTKSQAKSGSAETVTQRAVEEQETAEVHATDSGPGWADRDVPLHMNREFEKRLPVIESVLSLEEGEFELPLEASDVHLRRPPEIVDEATSIGRSRAELPPEQTPASPTEPEYSTAAEHEVTGEASLSPQEAAGGNGGDYEPPQPPLGAEQPFDNHEDPEPQPEAPAASPWFVRAGEQHQQRIGQALNPTEVPPPAATHTIERTRESIGAALLVGVVDWFGRRRLRRELRRGQKRQDKQFAVAQKQQRATNVSLHHELTRQHSLTERLKAEFETAKQFFARRHQAHDQVLHTAQTTLERQRVVTLPDIMRQVARAAVAETALEQAKVLPQDHHIERSSWHAIEVDKTGRAVEAPTFQYGEEFKHEQQIERQHDEAPITAGIPTFSLAGAAAAQANSSSASSARQASTPIETTMSERRNGQSPAARIIREPWFAVAAVVIFFAIIVAIIVH